MKANDLPVQWAKLPYYYAFIIMAAFTDLGVLSDQAFEIGAWPARDFQGRNQVRECRHQYPFLQDVLAFAISAFFVGMAGAVWGEYLTFHTTEHFPDYSGVCEHGSDVHSGRQRDRSPGPVIGAVLLVTFNEFFVATLGASEINVLATGLIMMLCLDVFPARHRRITGQGRTPAARFELGLVVVKKIELYNAPQSTCSQRVRYVLNTKGIAFDEHKLDLFSGDQLKPDYLRLNPNGVVPTLIHDGKIIIDSAVITEYLDEVFSHRSPLVPKDAAARATMRSMMRFIDEVPTPAIRIPSYNLAFLPHFQSMSEDAFQALADSKPLRREFLMRMGRTGFPKADMDEALGRLKRGVERMASWIEESGGPWLMGEELTLADIAVMPVIVRMDDVNLDDAWDDAPAVARWLEAIRATDPFEPTYYKGSLLTEKYPHLRQRPQR